jgi:hypothetical protein
MHTSHLVGQSVEIRGFSSPISAVILGVEAAGLWIHKGDVAVDVGDVRHIQDDFLSTVAQ